MLYDSNIKAEERGCGVKSDRIAKRREQSPEEARKSLFLKEKNLMQPVQTQRKGDARSQCSICLSVQKEIEFKSVILN